MPPRIAGDSRRQTLKYDALTNDEFVADPVCGPPPSAFSCFRIAFTRIVRVSWCFSSSCLRASALSQPLVGRRLCQSQVGGSIPPCGSHVWTLSPRLVATVPSFAAYNSTSRAKFSSDWPQPNMAPSMGIAFGTPSCVILTSVPPGTSLNVTVTFISPCISGSSLSNLSV